MRLHFAMVYLLVAASAQWTAYEREAPDFSAAQWALETS